MRLADWAVTMLVPSGDGAGGPWSVVPWQRRLFAAVEVRALARDPPSFEGEPGR